jgi:hypothetical protein
MSIGPALHRPRGAKGRGAALDRLRLLLAASLVLTAAPAPAATSGEATEPPRRYGNVRNVAYDQTSEVFLGRIAVGVVLIDSPGAIYTSDDVETVLAAVEGAMDYWTGQVGYVGVSFTYDVHTGVSCSRNFLSAQPKYLEPEWVGEVMQNMGYPGGSTDASEHVYPYLDSLRTRLGTEWAVCFFIPKVPAFNANYLSYAKVGGPFAVVPAGTPTGGNRMVAGRAFLSHLIIHDMGHLFWALNEYGEGLGDDVTPCGWRSGYFGVYNMNSRYQVPPHICLGAPHTDCAMDEPGPAVCDYTLAHMGLRDSDGDQLPDIVDTHPIIALDPIPDTITTVRPEISGRADEGFVPNRAGDGDRNPITFNVIERVIYRVDRMVDSLGRELWLDADPGGDLGDSTSALFSFLPDSLTAGRHRVIVRAVNSAGNPSDYLGEGVIDVYVKAVAVHDLRAEPDYGGGVKITFRVRGKTLGAEAALYRRTEEGGETLLHEFALIEDGTHSLFDGGSEPGKRTFYRLEASAEDLAWSWETEILGPSPIRTGRFLSIATPNPFRDRTVISYRVPRGDPIEQPVPDDGGDNPTPPGGEEAPSISKTGAARYEEVRVEVRIFNLAGRVVRAFPDVHSYEGFHADPVIWDGRDDEGNRLPAGVYFVRMKAGPVIESRKIVLLP